MKRLIILTSLALSLMHCITAPTDSEHKEESKKIILVQESPYTSSTSRIGWDLDQYEGMIAYYLFLKVRHSDGIEQDYSPEELKLESCIAIYGDTQGFRCDCIESIHPKGVVNLPYIKGVIVSIGIKTVFLK